MLCLLNAFCFFLFAAVASGQGIKCPGGKLTPKQRQQFVDLHNAFRSNLAKGREINKRGMRMPKAKNMLKMNYSCELEVGAQEWAENCVWEHSQAESYGENLYKSSFFGPPDFARQIKEAAPAKACKCWWGELRYKYLNNPSNMYTTRVHSWVVGHFTQMAWGSSSALGCGIADCKDKRNNMDEVLIVCRYLEAGNIINHLIYEIGNPCTEDSDCNTGKCSTAEGLCIKQ